MATAANPSTIATSQAELEALLADFLPRQGGWDAEGYLWLTDYTNRLIEFTDGRVEVLPMPTDEHQALLDFLAAAFNAFLRPRGGVARFAPLRLEVGPRRFREPDLVALRDARDPRRQSRYWRGADLVLEIVSPDQPARDLVVKRDEYAAAHIPEYWIVDPRDESIRVLGLEGDRYVEHGVFGRGARATSATLAGFTVEVGAAFDAD